MAAPAKVGFVLCPPRSTLFSLVRGLRLCLGHRVRLRRARYVRDRNRVLART